MTNPFEDFDPALLQPIPLQRFNSEPSGDTIIVNGARSTSSTILVENTTEFNPSRDAAVIYAMLSTSLHESTWQALCVKICQSDHAQSYFAALMRSPKILESLGLLAQKKPKKQRARKIIKDVNPIIEEGDTVDE